MTANRARFVVLEGLSCTGKSTIAPLLAQTVGADFFDTPVSELKQLRQSFDDDCSVNARAHFWMMANYLVSEHVRQSLNDGRSVVLESYFYRTIATHTALGVHPVPVVNWEQAVEPHAVALLQLDEGVRQQRLRERAAQAGTTYWHQREEANVTKTVQTYESFGLSAVDTTLRTPAQVVAGLQVLLDRPG